MSKHENSYTKHIPPEAIKSIENFELNLLSHQPKFVDSEYSFSIKLDYKASSLLEVLAQGVVFQITDDNVYIWYTPPTGLRFSYFALLIDFKVHSYPKDIGYKENMVTFYLSPFEKL